MLPLNLILLAYYEISVRGCPSLPRNRNTRDSYTILTCGKLFTTDDLKCFKMAKGGVKRFGQEMIRKYRGAAALHNLAGYDGPRHTAMWYSYHENLLSDLLPTILDCQKAHPTCPPAPPQ